MGNLFQLLLLLMFFILCNCSIDNGEDKILVIKISLEGEPLKDLGITNEQILIKVQEDLDLEFGKELKIQVKYSDLDFNKIYKDSIDQL